MLKNLRKINNLSQNQLSAGSGVNLKMIQKYEQGVRNINNAKLETLLKLCNALNCRLTELLTDPQLKEQLEIYERNQGGEYHG